LLPDEKIPRTCTTSIAGTLSLPFPLRNCVELNNVVDDLFLDVLILVLKVHIFLDLSVSFDFCNLILDHLENTSIPIYQEIILEL
jgi:hypothetical protein